MEIADLLRDRAENTGKAAAAKRKTIATFNTIFFILNKEDVSRCNTSRSSEEMDSDDSISPQKPTTSGTRSTPPKHWPITKDIVSEALDNALKANYPKIKQNKISLKRNLRRLKQKVPAIYQVPNEGTSDMFSETETIDENEVKNDSNLLPAVSQNQAVLESDDNKRECNQLVVRHYLSAAFYDEYNYGNKGSHNATIAKDYRIFNELLALRKFMITTVPFPILDTTPFADFVVAMKSNARCMCDLCQNNLQAVVLNVRMLANYSNVPKNDDNDEVQMDLKTEERKTRQNSSLPLKKRKF